MRGGLSSLRSVRISQPVAATKIVFFHSADFFAIGGVDRPAIFIIKTAVKFTGVNNGLNGENHPFTQYGAVTVF